MRQSIKTLVAELKQAKQALGDEIIAEMALVAQREGLDSFSLVLDNSYTIDGKQVQCQELDALDVEYCDHVNDYGIMLFWEKGKGYV